MMVPTLLLLFFATAIISVLFYYRTGHDICMVLAVSSAIVCLIWGLVVAHWSLQIFSLLAVLWFTSPIVGVARANK